MVLQLRMRAMFDAVMRADRAGLPLINPFMCFSEKGLQLELLLF